MVQLIANNTQVGDKNRLFSTIYTNILTVARIYEIGTFHKMSITVKQYTMSIRIGNGDTLLFEEGQTYSIEYPELNTQSVKITPLLDSSIVYITYQSI